MLHDVPLVTTREVIKLTQKSEIRSRVLPHSLQNCVNLCHQPHYLRSMPVYQLDPYHLAFPDPSLADADGLLAVGGSLREDWLLTAYANGIFPWFSEGDPPMWWSPDPRFVLFPERVKVSRSMKSMLSNTEFSFAMDTAFDKVIDRCADIPRHGQNGTWITRHMKQAYKNLHRIGMAHSAEVWQNGNLVGGLYGVSIGSAFFGESMYSDVSNASKYALIRICQWLAGRGFSFIDCQVYTSHLERMGAVMVSRDEFILMLENAMKAQTFRGAWQ